MKPPKSEARERVATTATVSFLPMEDLGIEQKFVQASQERRLSEVVGSYTYFADGDVLLAKITPCFENGKLGIAKGLKNGIGFGSSEYIVLRPHAELTKEWLYYYLSREEFRAKGAARMTGAVGHKRVPSDFIEAHPIPVPPLTEQQRIVHVLDKAFEELSVAKVSAEKNFQNARALFASELYRVFAERSEEWEDTTVGGLVDAGVLEPPLDGNHGEIHPKKADFVDTGVPFIMASDLKNGLVDQEDCTCITRRQADSLRKGFAKDGDVLLSHKGTIGRVAVLHTELDYVMLTPQVTYYRVSAPEQLLNRFLYFAFQAPEFVRTMTELAGAGSTRAYIGITKQRELPVCYPPYKEQERIAEKLETLRIETQQLESIYLRKVEALDALKESLLHEAFSGNV